MANFRVEYDNDTGPNDEGFFEYWLVTNDELSFRVDSSQQDADWLAGVLNTQQPAAAVPEGFAEWLAREMPAGTVIGNPQWWAKLIARRFAQFAAPAAPAAAVPEGYALVPVEPTDDMVWAGKSALATAYNTMRKGERRSPVSETWAAMLAAALDERKGE